MAIARSMITEGNKRQAIAVSKKDMNEIATTSALIGIAQLTMLKTDLIPSRKVQQVFQNVIQIVQGNGRNMKTYIKKRKKSVNNANISNRYQQSSKGM